MKMGEAKLLYESGAIYDPRIFIPSSGHGWCLDFKSNKEVAFNLYLEAERGGQRVFKTANAVVKACMNIGCEKAVLDLNGNNNGG